VGGDDCARLGEIPLGIGRSVTQKTGSGLGSRWREAWWPSRPGTPLSRDELPSKLGLYTAFETVGPVAGFVVLGMVAAWLLGALLRGVLKTA